MMKKIGSVLATMVALSGVAIASDGQVFYAEDASPAIRFHNTGSENVVITVTTNGAGSDMTVVMGSITNTIDGNGATDTVAELAAAVVACTNSAGKKPIVADTACAVATTESTDGELLDGATTIRPGEWGAIYWDTSTVKHYRTYIPPTDKGAKRGGLTVKKGYGNAGGTGNVAIKAYIDNVKVADVAVVSPLYASVDGTIIQTNAVAPGIFDIPLDLYVGAQEGFILEASRVTTGTTGGIGVTTENK